LTTIFRNESADRRETDKLVDLFRNRVELKKEFAALRNEKYQLLDRIKHHQGATARVQQQHAHLENLLRDPEWVHSVTAFYQLRALAEHCEKQLARFAEQLKQQREQRAHSELVASWKKQRMRKAGRIEERIGEHRAATQLLENRLQSERHRMLTMNGISRLFRGRAVAADVSELELQAETAQRVELELLDELDAVRKMIPPDQQGLDIHAKRSINFMILSFAQHLYLHFEEHDLVEMAKEASEKSVGAVNYGHKRDCDVILERLSKRMNTEDDSSELPQLLRNRARLIAEEAEFRNDDDPVPVPATVTTVFSISTGGTVERQHASILGNNYFGIAKVLSR
jgi:hypothetical protein